MTTSNLAELRQKAKLPAKQAGGAVVAKFFESNKAAMMAVLPKHVSAERMTRIALTALRNTPQLMQCTTESLMGAVMQCAQLGLEPNTVLGHAYLIPFQNRKAGRTDVQVIIGYKGLLTLARNSGQILSISAHAVRENDEFEFAYGIEDTLTHRPAMKDRGNIVAFYAVAKLKDGGHVFEVMSRDAVDSIMLQTQSKGKYGPWKDHYEEMGRKTLIRRLFKYLPVSIELATATAMDELAEKGKSQHLEDALSGEYTIVAEDYQDNSQDDDEAPITDANGEVYDPAIHATSKDGLPVFNSDGTFRARRGTKKSHADNEPQTAPTFADLAEQMKQAAAARDRDELDAMMDAANSLPDEQKSSLANLYEGLVAEIENSSEAA